MNGLIVKEFWADLILSGEKTLELRSSNTKIRGRIGIIKSGTKKVYGSVELVDTKKMDLKDFQESFTDHRVICDDLPYKNLHGWVLKYPVIFKKPIPYNHKLGCVIWVNLDDIKQLKGE